MPIASKRRNNERGEIIPFKQLIRSTIEEIHATGNNFRGLPTGLSSLDRWTGGFQSSDLIVLAARPSIGKTALAMNIAKGVASMRRGVLYFSLEMSKWQMTRRLLACEAMIDGSRCEKGLLAHDEMEVVALAGEKMANYPIFIEDSPSVSITKMKKASRQMVQSQKDPPISLIIVDYLQLMEPDPESMGAGRQQEVAEIIRGLKLLARELSLPILSLSQLSRAVECRTDKRPILSDLRESASIEQDADLVLFLYRDSYYHKNREESQGKAELIIAKNRSGSVGSFELLFFPKQYRFSEIE